MANASDALNFVAVEAAIVQRLTERLMTGDQPCVKKVLTGPEIAEVADDKQIAPAVFVVYLGWSVTPGASANGDASLQAVFQHRWAVVLVVKSAARMRESHPRHSEAGPILQRIAEALHGWKPLSGFKRLAPLTSAPVAYEPGLAYFPMGFSTSATAAVTPSA